MTIYKRPLAAHKMRFHFKNNPKVIMGHTRLATQGSEKMNENNHPFYSYKLDFALAHNGVLHNDKLLRETEKLPNPTIQTDSYIAVQLIEKKKTLNFESLKYMAEKVRGSFCFTVLDRVNNLYIVKGDNPMAIVDCGGFYMYASTIAILKRALKALKIKALEYIEIDEGEIFKICRTGKITRSTFEMADEFMYHLGYGYYGHYLDRYDKSKSFKEDDDMSVTEYLQSIFDYAETLGIDEDTIEELLAFGWSLDEVADMLYEQEWLNADEDFELTSEI